VAAAESTAVAAPAPVPSPRGGPCRTASQHDHEEGGEEKYSKPTVPMSCGVGHDHTSEATAVPAARGDGTAEGPVKSRLAPRACSRCRTTLPACRLAPTCRQLAHAVGRSMPSFCIRAEHRPHRVPARSRRPRRRRGCGPGDDVGGGDEPLRHRGRRRDLHGPLQCLRPLTRP